MTITDLVTIVDELTITSSPTPGARIIRHALLTELRAAVQPNLGGNDTGRSTGNRIPIDAGALAAWKDITREIAGLHHALNGDQPTTGSYEQILVAWSRDLVAADQEYGLAEDTLTTLHTKLARIRDRIRRFFDPPRSGDIPGEPCPACGFTTAHINRDGDTEQVPALGTSRDDINDTYTVICRSCHTTWPRQELTLLGALRRRYLAAFPTDKGLQ
jgi:hypothetical protein